MSDQEVMAIIGLDGSSKNFKPAYMQSYLMAWSQISGQINDKTSVKECEILVEKLINYVPLRSKRQHIYRWRNKRIHELMEETRRVKKQVLTDTEKNDCIRRANLQTMAEVNEYFQSAFGFERERGIGVVGFIGDGRRRFFPLKELPPDGTYVNIETGDVFTLRLRHILMRKESDEEIEEQLPHVEKLGTVPVEVAKQGLDGYDTAFEDNIYEHLSDIIQEREEERQDSVDKNSGF
jgi:hypothetical protein